ncbi:TetR/AcrR family transcriptional regulator [Comamonadaceae bacterium G21597-S1]|nr:TetR/AcrR family transcriptional regulator [Comamonadaceae bacterium G21597-S1]
MTTQSSTSSRAEKARATREHLIATAIDVVRQRTYGAATMFEVAKAAGVTPGALQHHFGSRAMLMLAILQTILEATDENAIPWPDTSLPLQPRAAAYLDALWTRLYEPARFLAAWSVYFGAADESALQPRIADMRRELSESLHARFAQVFPEAAARTDLPAFVDMVLSTLRGMGVVRLFGTQPQAEAAQRTQLAIVIATWCRNAPPIHEETP